MLPGYAKFIVRFGADSVRTPCHLGKGVRWFDDLNDGTSLLEPDVRCVLSILRQLSELAAKKDEEALVS